MKDENRSTAFISYTLNSHARQIDLTWLNLRGIEKSAPNAPAVRPPADRLLNPEQPLDTAAHNSCGQTRLTPKCKPVRSLFMPKRLKVGSIPTGPQITIAGRISLRKTHHAGFIALNGTPASAPQLYFDWRLQFELRGVSEMYYFERIWVEHNHILHSL
jgi:hypothetical protein